MSFPLERLLDLNIARTEKYADWSDRVLYHIEEDKEAFKGSETFFGSSRCTRVIYRASYQII